MIVGLITIQILLTAKQYWILREPTSKSKQKAQKIALRLPEIWDYTKIRVMYVKKVTYEETLRRQSHSIFRI